MALKPKPTKSELKEVAEEVVKGLEAQVNEFANQIAYFTARKEDAERKIRWVKRELLDTLN